MIYRLFQILKTIISKSFKVLNRLRIWTFNTLFLVFLIIVISTLISNRTPSIKSHTLLVIKWNGGLVEQREASLNKVVATLTGDTSEKNDIEMRELLPVLHHALIDPNISAVLLQTDHLDQIGLAQLNEIEPILDQFKQQHKPVIAWGTHYEQRQYLLASHSSQIFLDPMGDVMITGFGHARNYYRDALDKLGIQVHLMKVGTYKSFAEPFIANGPSQAATEADQSLYQALWHDTTRDIENSRQLPAGSLQQTIDNIPVLLTENQGNTAQLALKEHWVDNLLTHEELLHYLLNLGIAPNKSKSGVQTVNFFDYLDQLPPDEAGSSIAVIIAAGEIQDGQGKLGTIGGDTTSALIREARLDKETKAIVLRIDSPGGSAFASEQIRRELALAKKQGLPVLVSMGNVAASGGYWISLAADKVYADPDTVTGSIGVFSLFPTADLLMQKLGVHSAGVTTTWLSDAQNPLRPMDPRFEAILQSSVNHIYSEFVQRTADAHHKTTAEVDQVAQGRVWDGRQALAFGLIDELGSFTDAINQAAELAHTKTFHLTYFDTDNNWFDRVLANNSTLFSQLLLRAFSGQSSIPINSFIQPLSPLLKTLSTTSSPQITAHCLCINPI